MEDITPLISCIELPCLAPTTVPTNILIETPFGSQMKLPRNLIHAPLDSETTQNRYSYFNVSVLLKRNKRTIA